jgi:hypothetical protein
MVNEERYFDELQKIIGDTKSAEGINERWYMAVPSLSTASYELDP